MRGRRSTVARLILGAVCAVGVAACGSGAVPSTGSSSPVATLAATPQPSAGAAETASATASATATTTASPGSSPASTTFESTFYRYRITIPPKTLILSWRPALRPWDGTAKIDRVGPLTDRTATAEGGLFLFGAEAESLESWFERMEANGSRYHGCTPAQNRVDITINDVPAVAFTQRCAQSTNMARVSLWKDGYGIGAYLGETPVSQLVETRDRLVELLDGLEWVLD